MTNASSAVDRILDLLKNVKTDGAGWSARCPSHDDHANSLSVGQGDDGRVLLKCHVGCAVEAIVQVMGLAMRDLFPDREGGGGVHTPPESPATVQGSGKKREKSKASGGGSGTSRSATVGNGRNGHSGDTKGCTLAMYAETKHLPEDFLRKLGITDMVYMHTPALRIPYFGRDGEITAIRFRIGLDGKDKFRWRRGDKPTLYGLDRLAGDLPHIVLCEGESDSHVLWLHGEPALGLPGAANWNEDRDAWLFDGVETIFVVHEGDTGGNAVENWLSKSRIRDRAKLVSLAKFGVKDPAALHADDPEKFKERWREALAEAVPWVDREAETASEERAKAWTKCGNLASATNILDRFIAEFHQLAVGEDRTAKLIYLAVTSRLFDWPVSIAVKGPSSGGKSFVTEQVLKFFPKSAFYARTAMSERALAYSDEPLRHRFLVLYEAAGMEGDMQSYLIRSLLSEGRLSYELVEKTKEGLRSRLIEREGPTGLLVTTTAIHLHPENETRLLSVLVTDSHEQTRAVLAALADEDLDAPDFEPWLALQQWIEGGRCDVTIPYGKALASLVPASAVRLRRDFKAVLALIRAHALLHQVTRQRDDKGRVIATFEDYAAVREIVADVVAEGVEATVSATTRETVNAVKEVIGPDRETVSLADLMKKMGLDRSVVSRRARAAKGLGYLRDIETKKGKPSKLVLGDPMPEDIEVLPRVEVLQRCTTVTQGAHQSSYCKETEKADHCTVASDSEGQVTPPPPSPGQARNDEREMFEI